MTLIIILSAVIPILIFIFIISAYNGLVSSRNRVKTAFSTVDVMLKRRHDLIPNLVASVKQYMKHEESLLSQITETRAAAMQGSNLDSKMDAENKLGGLMGSLNVAIENYPNLKADKNVMHLQATLNEVEEQISASRRSYNNAVLRFNNSVESFPSNMIASMFSFEKATFFEATEQERANVNVSDLFNS